MQEQELQFDASTPVAAIADLAPLASATLTVFRPDGTTLYTGSATCSPISTTVADGTTAGVLALASVTGIVSGTQLRVTSDGVTYTMTAASVDSTAKTVTLATSLPAIPDTGSHVYGAQLTAVVPPSDANSVGGNYRMVWSYTDGTTTRQLSQPASIVRWMWTCPITAADVLTILAELNTKRGDVFCQSVVTTVDEAIRGKLLATGRRPWLYLSSAIFSDAAKALIRYELAVRGISFGGQIYEAQRETRFAADDKLQSVIAGLQGITDTNADGQITADENKPRGFTSRVSR